MGHPVKFHGYNLMMKPAPGQEGFVQDMHIFSNDHVCVSCWEFTRDEMIEMLKNQDTEPIRVFVSVFSGKSQPPIFVGSEDTTRNVVSDFGKVWKKE